MIKLKVFDLTNNPETGELDDAALHEFQEDKEVLSFSDHFYMEHGEPHLVVLVSYREMRSAQTSGKKSPRKSRQDWRNMLNAEEKQQYDLLRTWRGQRATDEGIPPYVILTNRLLAEIVQLQPTSVTQLRSLQGIGPATCDKYGDDILACLEKREEAEEATEEPNEEGGQR